MRRLVFLALTLTLINGCNLTAKRSPQSTSRAQSSSERQNSLLGIHQWILRGRISILTKEDGWNGSLFWNQLDNDNYDIRIIAPLGQGSLRLLGSEAGVSLQTSDSKQVFEARDAETLLQQEMGWEMPISGMRYWILGLTSPSPYKNIKLDKQGQVKSFEQTGWDVRFLRYKQVNDLVVPDKLVLENEKFKVKVIVKSWQLEK